MTVAEELEEGQEICPICGEINLPGACETCGHYVGMLWDGFPTWQVDGAAQYWDLCNLIVELILEEAGEDDTGIAKRAADRLQAVGAAHIFGAAADLGEELTTWFFIEEQPEIRLHGLITGGHTLMEGSGTSIYCEHPADQVFLRLVREAEFALATLQSLNDPD